MYNNLQNTETFANILYNVTKDLSSQTISKNIIKLTETIPTSDIANKLMAEPNIKDKYIGYDQYEIHNKYKKYKQDIQNDIEFIGYAKIQYINVCSWLIDEIEKLICDIVNTNKHTLDKFYYTDNYIDNLALTTDTNDPIITAWINMKLELPFSLITNIMLNKGFYISVNLEELDCYQVYKLKLSMNKRSRLISC